MEIELAPGYSTWGHHRKHLLGPLTDKRTLCGFSTGYTAHLGVRRKVAHWSSICCNCRRVYQRRTGADAGYPR